MAGGELAARTPVGADEDQIDVFVSYAHADDEKPIGAQWGWVTTLVEELRKVLRRRLGRQGARIWMDHELAAHHHVTETLTRRASTSRTLVLVLSPGYIQSDWCQRELAIFWSCAQAAGKAASIFPIEIEPITRELCPHPIRDLTPLPFWERSGPNGVHSLCGYPQPKLDEDTHYWKQINLLAHDLTQHLKKPPSSPIPVGDLAPLVPSRGTRTRSHSRSTQTNSLPRLPGPADDEMLSIYLHGAPEDLLNVELIADHLAALGVQVLMTPEPDEGKTYLDCLREQRDLMRDCQGFVLVRGHSPAGNLQVAYQYAQQTFGLGRRDPWAAAINLPPPGRPGLPIRSPTLVQVDCTNGFQADLLRPYLAGLKASRATNQIRPNYGAGLV